jgi:hypothetical protein
MQRKLDSVSSPKRKKNMNTVINFDIKVWGDTFKDGYDQDGWAQNDRHAKLANMIMILDKVDLATASRRANEAVRDLGGNTQKACDIIRAELIANQSRTNAK